MKFSHIKTATKATWKEVVIFSRYFWFALILLFDWLRDFSTVDATYKFLLPKLLIILVGALVTGIPFFFLVPLAFLPAPVVAPIFFVAFVIMFAHF